MGFPWGVDLGNQNCVVAIARKGGIDVIDNEASSRKTPCMVGLGGKERGIGESAKSRITSNIRNTVTELKSLIGRRWAEEGVQQLKDQVAFTMKEAPDGGIHIELHYEKDGQESKPTLFTPEQLLAMLFVNLKHTAEEHNKSPSPDCVISVPCYFNDSQRRAVLDAADIAGLKVLQLMNDTTAAALNWGLPKSLEFPEDSAPPKHVLFFDMGFSCTQVCVVAFTKSKMTVLATAFDRNLGGKEFDMCMIQYFAEEWKKKTGLDLLNNPKALYRLSVAVDKVKQQLSGYTSSAKLPVNVECMQEDRDFASYIDTETWWELTKPLCEKALDPVKAVIRDSKLNFDQIDEIEVVGSATRSPLITNALRDFLGKEPKRTMNSEEAVAKGCALRAAMISPNFRVRDFSILDSTPYAISLSWSTSQPEPGSKRARVQAIMPPEQGGDAMDVDNQQKSTLFTQHHVIPASKMVTFMRSQPFEIVAAYADPDVLAPGMPSQIAKFSITNVPPGPDGGPAKVKVRVRLDPNGVLSVESAQAVEEIEMEVEAAKGEEKGDAPMADSDKPPEAPAPDASGQQPANADASAEEAKPAAEPEKKRKVKKHDLPVTTKANYQVTPRDMEAFKTFEYEMSVQDRHIKELHARKNDLETYIYNMRDRCSSGDLAAYISQADKDKFMPMLDEMENWLYSEEAETANKSSFVAKLDQLKQYGGPALERAREADERPLAFQELEKSIAEFDGFPASTDEQYAHISAEDRAKVRDAVDAAKKWSQQMQQEQAQRAPHEPLVVKTADIKQKKTGLMYDCQQIRNKPKPAPKVEPKAEEKKEDIPPAGGAADAPSGTAPTPEAMDEGLD